MRLRPEQLTQHLAKGLAPVYLVSGDEPLLVQEAADIIRQQARAQGCVERIVLDIERSADWQDLLHEAGGLSLFASKRLLELRLPSGKPGDAGSKVLQAYVEQADAVDVLLMVCAKIDKASQSTKWFKALDQVGVIVQLWPLSGEPLLGWINQRMRRLGLQADKQAVALLAERSEGNLLATAQEIDKLKLLYEGAQLSAEQVMAAVANSARYDVFALVDSILAGQAARVSRMLQGLRDEGVEPVLVLWAIAREIRLLSTLAEASRQGGSLEQLYRQHRVWENRKRLLQQALQRHDIAVWRSLLVQAACLDRVIKGKAAGNSWDELLQLALEMAGVPLGLGRMSAPG